MKILVIGGSGFIGSRIIRQLLAGGDQVVCFDVISKPDAWGEESSKVEVVRGDVNEIDQLIETIQQHRPDAIINMAYYLGRPTETRPHSTLKLNIIGMGNVFEAARLMGVKRVIFASSIAVYGPQSLFGDRPVTEEDIPQPVWVYGGHKLFNEFMAAKYRDIYGMEVVAVRIAASFGFGREVSWGGYNTILMTEPAQGRPIRIPMNSAQRFPLVYVDDAADLFVRVCRAEKVEHTVYGTGGHTISMGEIAEVVRELVPGAQIEFDEEAAPLPNLYRVGFERAQREFGYKQRPVRDGIRLTVEEAQKAKR